MPSLTSNAKTSYQRNPTTSLREIYLRIHEGKSYDQAHSESGGTGEMSYFIVD